MKDKINKKLFKQNNNYEFNKIQKHNSFLDELKNIETEETKLLKLQKKYREGKINEKDLSDEQISSLSKLYDQQIANLKKSNELRKQKLLQYRMNMYKNN